MKNKKRKVPRKLKKQTHKANIIMDRNALPLFAGDCIMDRIHNIKTFFNETGMLLWDSDNRGAIEPKLIGCKTKLRVIDSSKNLDIRYKFNKHQIL